MLQQSCFFNRKSSCFVIHSSFFSGKAVWVLAKTKMHPAGKISSQPGQNMKTPPKRRRSRAELLPPCHARPRGRCQAPCPACPSARLLATGIAPQPMTHPYVARLSGTPSPTKKKKSLAGRDFRARCALFTRTRDFLKVTISIASGPSRRCPCGCFTVCFLY